MTKLESLTEDQARRLLAVIDSGKGRNWDWLLAWLMDQGPSNYTDPSYGNFSIPENLVRFYEIDTGWEEWTPEGRHSDA